MNKKVSKHEFLWQALYEMDGYDGIISAQDMYDFLVSRDGSCPYSIDELEAWLNEVEE